MSQKREKILVIRLGALGDLIFCMQAFQDIRRAHPDAEIALLTRAPFAEFAKAMPWFDRVIIETHPRFTAWGGWLRLRKEIKIFNPTLVFDLQGKSRQSILYALLGGPWGAQWSGAAPFCALPRPFPPTPEMHFMDFVGAQLRSASVPPSGPILLDWLNAPTDRFALPERFVVLIPGCSPHVPRKRWPSQNYGALAQALEKKKLACVIIGTKADADAAAIIQNSAPNVINLCGQTSLFELAGIFRKAAGVIGNDTGPLHMAAAVGAPTLALFSGRTNPVWTKPPGSRVTWRQSEELINLELREVAFAFDLLLQHAERERR